MPSAMFFRLPEDRRARVVDEAIIEFSDRPYAEASLSQIVRRAGIAKGSIYQYFEDKLDLYRWLLTDEVPRRKRDFVGTLDGGEGDFWGRLERMIERGMAFLVEHPRLARMSAAAADPTAAPEVRGLHAAICEAGLAELRRSLELGVKAGAVSREVDLDIATHFVSAVTGPGLTDVVLRELGAPLHEVLASDSLRGGLDARRRQRLSRQAVMLIRDGLGNRESRGGARKRKE